jgi:integrase/recombinase XerD
VTVRGIRSGGRKSLQLLAWPAADRLAWEDATRPGRDILDDAGPASHWAASTRAAVQYDYGRWLGYVAVSEPDALTLAPGARASKARLTGFLAHLGESVGSVGQHSTIRHLRDALVAMVPGWDRTGLDRLVSRLERDRRGRDKHPRLVASNRLLALGQALMNAVSPGPAFQVEDLLVYRDGLMIALLASRPLRRRNFAAIEIGRHLIRVGDTFHLVFDGSETKSGQSIETDVPAALVAPLEHYLIKIRPLFPHAGSHRALWAGLKGRGLGGQAIYDTIAARTKTAFGHVVNPHLFRDCAATTIAIAQPGQIGVARDLLGHTSLHTTNTYYNQARSIEASRLYATVLSASQTKTT